jgi:hypothetical protein
MKSIEREQPRDWRVLPFGKMRDRLAALSPVLPFDPATEIVVAG